MAGDELDDIHREVVILTEELKTEMVNRIAAMRNAARAAGQNELAEAMDEAIAELVTIHVGIHCPDFSI